MCYVWLVLTIYFGLQDNLLATFLLNLTFVLFCKPWLFFLDCLGQVYQIIKSVTFALSGDKEAMQEQAARFETYMLLAYVMKDAEGCVKIEMKEA